MFSFLITPINIVTFCATMVIILFFIFDLLLYWTVIILNCYCIKRYCFCFWTVIVLNCYYIELLLFLFLNCYYIELLLFWTVTILNCYYFESLLSWTVIVFVFESLLSSEVTFRPLLRFLTISRVLELFFKRGWSRWKAKTLGYKSSEGRRTQFCPQDSQNCSSTNQSYYPTESVMT
jgi:hypothetical protein